MNQEPTSPASDDAACSPSSDTPETDANEYSGSTFRNAPDTVRLVNSDLARKLERERNEWKQHAWRESDMREKLQGRIMALVTTDNESKEEFIQRVRGILSENEKKSIRGRK